MPPVAKPIDPDQPAQAGTLRRLPHPDHVLTHRSRLGQVSHLGKRSGFLRCSMAVRISLAYKSQQRL